MINKSKYYHDILYSMSGLKDKILMVATDLFHTRGINSTGVDTVVAVAGTTKMTLYKYFDSKEELILQVLQKSQQDFQNWLSERLNSNSKKPADKIKQLLNGEVGDLKGNNTLNLTIVLKTLIDM